MWQNAQCANMRAKWDQTYAVGEVLPVLFAADRGLMLPGRCAAPDGLVAVAVMDLCVGEAALGGCEAAGAAAVVEISGTGALS